jgi:sigma-B regulation protein RsbU (phosphoserine phosphatase)
MGNPDGSLELLDTSGLFLGVSKRTTYEDRTHPFPKGSFLLTYSDALIEETVPGVEALGEEGLLALTERILASNPAKPMKALTDSFFASYAHPPLTDDLTCLWISRPS